MHDYDYHMKANEELLLPGDKSKINQFEAQKMIVIVIHVYHFKK